MVEKMSFVSVTGPRNDIDRVIKKYLSKYEIHLEYAVSELKSVNNLRPIVEQNPYRQELAYITEIEQILGKTEEQGKQNEEIKKITLEDAKDFLEKIHNLIEKNKAKIKELTDKQAELKETIDRIQPFTSIEYDIDQIFGFTHLKYRFGRVSVEFSDRFRNYVNESIETVFVKTKEDAEYIWGVYFVAESEKAKVDAAFTALNFERLKVPKELHGTMASEYERITEEYNSINDELERIQTELKEKIKSVKSDFYSSKAVLNEFTVNFEARKYAACTEQKGAEHYILCGWMTETDADAMKKEIEANEVETVCISDNNHEETTPPTKLKNKGIFKPFEMFIKMYGLPAYNEIDPTKFVALTYAFIFGAMFGDVGQGLLLLIGGFILYKVKKMNLAAIVSCAGFFSTIFGFLFGSIFGFEDIIDAVWLRPVNAMMEVPFIGKLNTVFVFALGFGMILILITQILHIINAIKAKDTEAKWFDTNGVAGLVFYGSIVLVVVLMMNHKALPAGIILGVMFGLPLILIALKEPLTKILERKKEKMSEGIVMFIVQAFFELFEVLLSYFSNTLSFIRIGAFAVSHASMMEVVLMLAGAENGNTGNLVVIILGNLFVCGFEGLIVGIQVLRLEYYELFSRFYKGTGRAFKPYK